MERGANVDARDSGALIAALMSGHEDTVALLEAKCTNKLTSEQLNNALIRACYGENFRDGNVPAIEMLLERGADIDARDGGALSAVLEHGNKRAVALLEAKGAKKLTLEQLNNALIRVCCDGSFGFNVYAAIDMLLEQGADVNTRNSGALTAALEYGSKALVDTLEAKGANKLTLEQLNGTLIRACQRHCLEDPDYFKARRAIVLLLDRGADINTDDSSPFLEALLRGDVEIAILLEDMGAEIPPLARLNDALIGIREQRCPSARTVEILVRCGADIDAGNKGSWPSTLLHFNRPEIFSD